MLDANKNIYIYTTYLICITFGVLKHLKWWVQPYHIYDLELTIIITTVATVLLSIMSIVYCWCSTEGPLPFVNSWHDWLYYWSSVESEWVLVLKRLKDKDRGDTLGHFAVNVESSWGLLINWQTWFNKFLSPDQKLVGLTGHLFRSVSTMIWNIWGGFLFCHLSSHASGCSSLHLLFRYTAHLYIWVCIHTLIY